MRGGGVYLPVDFTWSTSVFTAKYYSWHNFVSKFYFSLTRKALDVSTVLTSVHYRNIELKLCLFHFFIIGKGLDAFY